MRANSNNRAHCGDSMDRWLKRTHTIYALIATVGLLVIATMSYGFNKGIHIYKLHYPWVVASAEIRIEVTTASLRFEEILRGNTTRTMRSVWLHLDSAQTYADAILNGLQNQTMRLFPLDDPQLRAGISALREQLLELRRLAEKRLALHEKAIDPQLDINRAYYALLDEFLHGAIRFEKHIKGLMQHDYGHFYNGMFIIIVFCTALFIFSGLAYRRFEAVRAKDYQYLYETKIKLENEIRQRKEMEQLVIRHKKLAALGTLISGLAHEINNPNGVLLFNLPILKDYLNEITPAVEYYAQHHPDFQVSGLACDEFLADLTSLIDNLGNASRRIDMLISHLKHFYHLNIQKDNFWIDVGEAIEKALTACQVLGFDRRLVKREIAGDLPKIFTNGDTLRQIVVNVLVNAFQAQDKPEPWILIKAVTESGPPEVLRIEIHDNGCGMDQDIMEKIFEPFFTTRAPGQGLGLGLFICQRLIENLDGRIQVTSDPGSGSIVTLEIKTSRDGSD